MLTENWAWIQSFWESQSEKWSLSDWRFGKNRRKTSIALTNFTKKTVTVSEYFLQNAQPAAMKNAVLHEIAHILAGYESGHNATWRAIAKQIGCDGKVCGEMTSPPYKYSLNCPQGCFQKPYYRKPKLTNKVCKKCRSSPILLQLF